MAQAKVYNLEGKEVEELELADDVFAVSANDDLINQIALTIADNRRQVLADTKTRAERAGSGIKPWRQKGTGRARIGSIRAPHWKKGGVSFGPTSERNFKKKVNKKMNQKAIAMVLSEKLKDKEIMIVSKLELKDKKTKEMASVISALKLKGKTLVAFSLEEKSLRLASRNLAGVTNIMTSQINVLDMLKSKNLLLSKDSVKYLEEKYKKTN